MKYIPLTQGQQAIVDDEDFDYVNQWKWQAHWDSSLKSYVAVRTDYASGKELIYMHRFILGLRAGDTRKADHIITGNNLDNRRSNLRVASNAQNCYNRRKKSDSTSPYKGITFHKQSGKWRARVQAEGKRKSLGLFNTPEEAYKKYCEVAREQHGEFVNFG